MTLVALIVGIGLASAYLLWTREQPDRGAPLHVVWDVGFHLQGAGAEYTLRRYPWVCVSFDLMVAGAVLIASRSAVYQKSNERT